MCTTCGCGTGNVKIEGEHHHDHDHGHSHSHDHGHSHEHNHGHSHSYNEMAQVVHHHHYYGPVHIHYHNSENDTKETNVSDAHSHSHDHDHPHEHDHGHNHDHHHPHEHDHEHSHNHHHPHDHDHEHSHDHQHTHEHHHHDHTPEHFTPEQSGDDLHFGQGAARSHAPGMTQSRMVQIEQDILSKNDDIAEKNRAFLQERQIKALNMVSSPGSGKTTLLTETLKRLDKEKCAVIEGDQQTTNDADRIRETGAKAIQINTGKGCHLDAQMVSRAIANLDPKKESTLFIENVGNLVCPAAFDLGESHKVAILSVTEGEDKPLKYPDIFANADLMIINKIDLLPHLNFDLDACIQNAKRVNPEMKTMLVSATTGDGMQEWIDWLEDNDSGDKS